MYCQIIFAQSDETFDEAEDMLREGGFVTSENIERTIEFLSQWDYGAESEYDDALVDEIEDNRGEDIYESEDGQYVLVHFPGLYIGLYRVID